jgi:N-glycosylase/DNA lyase
VKELATKSTKIHEKVPSVADLYREIKSDIDERLAEFVRTGENTEAVFLEICFCTCTPQNEAHRAWGAVTALKDAGLLSRGTAARIAPVLRDNGVRFHNNKARFLVENRAKFPLTFSGTSYDIRNKLAENMSGWGMKEASHFLRNTGKGAGLAILDRHILRCLVECGVLDAVPESLSKKVYLETEQKMLSFAKKMKIPVEALDLVFWYREKGEIFK